MALVRQSINVFSPLFALEKQSGQSNDKLFDNLTLTLISFLHQGHSLLGVYSVQRLESIVCHFLPRIKFFTE